MGFYTPREKPTDNDVYRRTQLLKSMHIAMWCLSAAGRLMVHQYLSDGSQLQPCTRVLLDPAASLPPICDGSEAGVGFWGSMCLFSGVHVVASSPQLVWAKSISSCGALFVISSLVLMAWVCLAIGIAGLAF